MDVALFSTMADTAEDEVPIREGAVTQLLAEGL
jgi:hypothetical protein